VQAISWFISVFAEADPLTLIIAVGLVLGIGTKKIADVIQYGWKGRKPIGLPTSGELTAQFHDVRRLASRQSRMETVTLPDEQRRVAADTADDIAEALEKHYLALKVSSLGTKEGLLRDRDVHEYRMLSRRIREDVFAKFARIIRENNLIERVDHDFDHYISERTQQIERMITRTIDDLYWPDAVPHTIDVYDSNDLHVMPKVRTMIADTLRRFRVLAVEHHKKMDELDEEIACIANQTCNMEES